MKKYNNNSLSAIIRYSALTAIALISFVVAQSQAQAVLEQEIEITNNALFFDGRRVGGGFADNNAQPYNYRFGPQISAHGDAIKKYKNFIFTTWYKGGSLNRDLMLSRYNLDTGALRTIQFPHKHTGLKDRWWIGESHNYISVGISPKDETIHLLYDMHAYKNSGGQRNNYFRYSFSVKDAATVADRDFKLDLFVPDRANDYTHVSLNGTPDPAQFEGLTYPRFFLNDNNDLFMHMRRGANDNGAYVFSQYNATTSKWNRLTQLNHLNASRRGVSHNWGLYGSVKYVDGKLRTAFQIRSANKNDRYRAQNGVFYAYSDDQSGRSQWKDHTGQGFDIPYADPDIIKIIEPGDYVSTRAKDKVNIVRGFDWTVTERGDVHIISRVQDTQNNETVHLHTYKPRNSDVFITSTNFSGGEQIYTSGNSVYIVGLKRGRPVVQRAQGGTNTFETIYEASSGRTFRHGVPYISDGKLYYYLQERTDVPKSEVPLFVQVIDLGIVSPSRSDTAPSQSNSGAALNVLSDDGCLQYTGRSRVEVDLTLSRCVDISVGLFGNILQISDSIEKLCNFRGKVRTVGGRGTMIVDENFEARSDLTGRRILFEPSNTCRAVQMRVR